MHQISDSAYFTLFESHWRHGLVVRGGTTAQNLQRILTVQKRDNSSFRGLNYSENCKETFKLQKINSSGAEYPWDHHICRLIRSNKTSTNTTGITFSWKPIFLAFMTCSLTTRRDYLSSGHNQLALAILLQYEIYFIDRILDVNTPNHWINT